MRFRDRIDAGVHLADLLVGRELTDPVVLALPRGGVPVASEVAARFRAPLQVFVARKLGAPSQPELGIGAIAEGGTTVLNAHLVDALGLTDDQLAGLRVREERELERRVERYRQGRPLPRLAGRHVVLVDDGLATGVTAEAALRAIADREPARLVLAVPVGAPDTVDRLGSLAEIACVAVPSDFRAVGRWYDRFDQTTDETVLDLLDRARRSATEGA